MMKFIRIAAVIVASLLAGVLFTPGSASATPGWPASLEAEVHGAEALANSWAASQGVPAPAWRHISDPSQACMPASVVYCFADQTVYVTPQGITQWSPAGHMGSKFVVGHEATHRLQNPSDFRGVATELQANCGAGVFVRWLQDTGAVTQGDASLLQQQLVANGVADSVHGSVAAQADAFNRGYGAGTLSACNALAGPLLGT